MNTHLSAAMSRAFLEANRLCMDSNAEPQSPGRMMFLPALVCAAFSAEVGLKTILASEGQPSQGHNLLKLFERLSNESQSSIIYYTANEIEPFYKKLKIAKLAFIEWRYIYEETEERSVSLDFLCLFAVAVEKQMSRLQHAA